MTMILTTLSLVMILFTSSAAGEKVLGEETDEFDFDGLPGAQHEFKIEIGAGREECFYQKIVAGGKIHVSFEVLRGGDGNSALYLLDHDHVTDRISVLEKTDQVPRGGFQYGPFEETRPYAICLDNTQSRMASKLVYVYLVTYVEEEWSKYRQEIEDLSLTVSNFTDTIQHVQESITDALVHQAKSRMDVIRDWYTITGNNSYVQRWSMCQCVVVVLSACIQVYFVRRLFRFTTVTGTHKPRA
ncbi:transmembrane emp24 domain-containing protein 6-like isoform X1 [Mya arenaria]|uniref:transmembrane emp24 domain-containing protein 6-like isoform X1 n=1 Tax=Mya arenaria TaxID=6604 RepID=UPI0022E632B0|nr:transmembrane emp24 domain-containing protein 6-like isoform X1 [Mya arenaria]